MDVEKNSVQTIRQRVRPALVEGAGDTMRGCGGFLSKVVLLSAPRTDSRYLPDVPAVCVPAALENATGRIADLEYHRAQEEHLSMENFHIKLRNVSQCAGYVLF
jgi:hypothetical protein